MKKLSVLLVCFAWLISSCDSPMGDLSNSNPSGNIQQKKGIPVGTSRAQADTMRKTAWQSFRTQNGKGWHIRWSKQTGLPVSVYSGLTEKTYSGSPRKAARAFLADHPTLFGFSGPDQLKYVKTQRHKGVQHVTFNQVVNGIPVYEAEYKVHLRANGRISMVNGTLYPKLEISTSPSISVSGAVHTARSI